MIRQHQVTAAVAITLALAASLAPTASADPAPLAQAEAAIAASQNRASSTIRPNPAQQTGAAAAAYTGPCSEVCSGAGYGPRTTTSWTPDESGATLPHNPRTRSATLAQQPISLAVIQRGAAELGLRPGVFGPSGTSVRGATHGGGFNWGDAGIGAGVSGVLLGIGLAGIWTVTKGRKRHLAESRTIATS